MRDYIKKYPWARLRALWSMEIDEERDAMDDMPEGWKIAFGDLMFEELDEAIFRENLQDDFVVEQVKEKFGGLRFYVNVANESIWDIIDKYEAISEHVCIECGKPDVPMLNTAWISPMCPECFKKAYPKSSKTYEELSSEIAEMPSEITFHGFRNGERYERTISFGDTPQKIRELHQKRILNKKELD